MNNLEYIEKQILEIRLDQVRIAEKMEFLKVLLLEILRELDKKA